MRVEAECVEDLAFDVEEAVALQDIGCFGEVIGFWIWLRGGGCGGEAGGWRE